MNNSWFESNGHINEWKLDKITTKEKDLIIEAVNNHELIKKENEELKTKLMMLSQDIDYLNNQINELKELNEYFEKRISTLLAMID